MISDEEILRKAKTEWEMHVEEVLRYEQIAKPEHYGKYGTLALAYLQNHRIDKLVEINDRLGSAESKGAEAQIIKSLRGLTHETSEQDFSWAFRRKIHKRRSFVNGERTWYPWRWNTPSHIKNKEN